MIKTRALLAAQENRAKSPEVFSLSTTPVEDLMAFSEKHHFGFEDMGERGQLLLPVKEDDFIWYPKPMFPKKIHPEAIRRHEMIKKELPQIEIVQVIVGDEIEEESDWEEAATEADEKVKASVEKAKKALPTIAKVGLIAMVAAVAIPVVVGVAALALPALALGAVAVDPKYVLIVSDGSTTHAVCIASWLD
jgi:hypothetical protein